MTYESIEYAVEDHVALLTYNRPAQRNAISRKMNTELHDAWMRFRDDREAFVLVIAGAGDDFCAGWDLEDAAEWPMPDYDEYRKELYNLPGVCGYTRKVDVFKPVIAAVQGHAVAAGLETALLADIRIAGNTPSSTRPHQTRTSERAMAPSAIRRKLTRLTRGSSSSSEPPARTPATTNPGKPAPEPTSNHAPPSAAHSCATCTAASASSMCSKSASPSSPGPSRFMLRP